MLKKIKYNDNIIKNKEEIYENFINEMDLIDYKTNTFEVLDILIENDKIKKISKEISEEADNIIDCTNLNIIPGMIDMHCHLREPGFEHKETIETGAKSSH